MGSSTSIRNTPQACDDQGQTSDDAAITIDVLANDLGGNAKKLYSLDQNSSTNVALTSFSAFGASIRIVDGRVVYDPTAAGVLQNLKAGELVIDTFTYVIQLGNGALSVATVSVEITGTGPNEIVGTQLRDVLNGTAYADAIRGLESNDTLYGNGGNDFLYGNDGNDRLLGGDGSDLLDGGSGSDTTSYLDAPSSVTVNLGITGPQQTGGGGVDTLISVENLIGSNYDDVLTGDDNDNTITGLFGVDVIRGGGGNDRLIGDTGTNEDLALGASDLMYGGAGDDTYSVYQAGDIVVEYIAEGTDTIFASVDYVLPDNVENLIIFNGALIGTGNNLSNKITGNALGNILNGKGGHDDLVGGGGSDTFVFDAPDLLSSDIIRDFVGGLDKVAISISGFGLQAAVGSPLDPGYFVVDNLAPVNSTAGGHGQFVMFNQSTTTHHLYWDPDGVASAAPILVATFLGSSVPALSDFLLVL